MLLAQIVAGLSALHLMLLNLHPPLIMRFCVCSLARWRGIAVGPSVELFRAARRLVSQSLINVKEVKRAQCISCDERAGRLVREYASPVFSSGTDTFSALALSQPKVCRTNNISWLAMHLTVW